MSRINYNKIFKNKNRIPYFRILTFLISKFELANLGRLERNPYSDILTNIQDDICTQKEIDFIISNINKIKNDLGIEIAYPFDITEQNFKAFYDIFKGNILTESILKAFKFSFHSSLYSTFYNRVLYYELLQTHLRYKHPFSTQYGLFIDDLTSISVNEHPLSHIGTECFINRIKFFIQKINKSIISQILIEITFFNQEIGLKECVVHLKSKEFQEYLQSISDEQRFLVIILLSPILRNFYDKHFNSEDLFLAQFGNISYLIVENFVKYISHRRRNGFNKQIGQFELMRQYIIDFYQEYFVDKSINKERTIIYNYSEKGIIRKDIPFLKKLDNTISEIFTDFINYHCSDDVVKIFSETWFTQGIKSLGENKDHMYEYLIAFLRNNTKTVRSVRNIIKKYFKRKYININLQENISCIIHKELNTTFLDFTSQYETVNLLLIEAYAHHFQDQKSIQQFFSHEINFSKDREVLTRLYQSYKEYLLFISKIDIIGTDNFVEHYVKQNELINVNTCYNKYADNFYTIGHHFISNVSHLFFLQYKGKIIGKIPVYIDVDSNNFITPGVYIGNGDKRFSYVIEGAINKHGGFHKNDVSEDGFAVKLFNKDKNYKKAPYYIDDFFRLSYITK